MIDIPAAPVNDNALSLLETARRYAAAGLSTIPIKTDGSKSPAFSGWREYATRRPTDDELVRWFGRGDVGIGNTGGAASGNLGVLDYETWASFRDWGSRLSLDERDALARCPIVGTPKGGAHVYVRVSEPVSGHKLARTAAGETLIEVRGAQHFVVAPGSPPACHPTGNVWRIIRDGWLDGGAFEPMPVETWRDLELHAVALNKYARPAAREVVGERKGGEVGDRPGDHFNGRVAWADVLGPHGWKVWCTSGAVTYWTRPGKAGGVSASTGHCRGDSGQDLFYLFSTNATPFEAETSYSRFAVYALLNHRGDFKAATRALANAGYGLGRDEWLKRQPKVRVGGKVVMR